MGFILGRMQLKWTLITELQFKIAENWLLQVKVITEKNLDMQQFGHPSNCARTIKYFVFKLTEIKDRKYHLFLSNSWPPNSFPNKSISQIFQTSLVYSQVQLLSSDMLYLTHLSHQRNQTQHNTSMNHSHFRHMSFSFPASLIYGLDFT